MFVFKCILQYSFSILEYTFEIFCILKYYYVFTYYLCFYIWEDNFLSLFHAGYIIMAQKKGKRKVVESQEIDVTPSKRVHNEQEAVAGEAACAGVVAEAASAGETAEAAVTGEVAGSGVVEEPAVCCDTAVVPLTRPSVKVCLVVFVKYH